METLIILFFLPFLFLVANSQRPGFVSIDCGGTNNFTDDLGLDWVSDNQSIYGTGFNLSVPSEKQKQYTTLRYFPADTRKYCYRFSVKPRTRYLVRASFLYGNFDNSNVYPKFDIYLGATHWSTIVISDADTIEVKELILLAYSPTISVCLSNATTGQPFISTLELRQFNGSVYYTDYETQFFLSLSARINFGSVSDNPVRYPDDPFDRIWESDSLKKANYLVDVAAGTEKVSTNMSIDVNRDERPPVKVMQTAVVGRNGTLTYRLNLDGFPGFGWAVSYFAEIEDLGPTETRKFRLHIPGMPEYSKASVNIQENAQGRYRLYEPGFTNISLPFVLSFAFMKTSDSTMGPMLNAMEIYKYLQINYGSQDATLISNLTSRYPQADWAQEGGDPCLPVPSSWVQCNSDPQPKIVSIILSGKNLTGNIPSELTELTGLVELWLDGNSLTGPIPDFSHCPNLKKIHLENNRLTGVVPSSLVDLQNLSELFLQNNLLSGALPRGLLNKNLNLNYYGNINLHFEKSGRKRTEILIASVVGATVLVMVAIACFFIIYNRKKRDSNEGDVTRPLPPQKLVSYLSNAAAESAHCFTLLEIEQWTVKFEKQIGSGGYGLVYYGKMKDGKEIAVKVLTNDSYQGKREFSNEFRTEPSVGSSALRLLKMQQKQLTDKSDVYSFGVILLELISGREAISNESFGMNCRNIVHWAKSHIESGNIQGIIDPSLRSDFDIQSVWKVAEKAMMCIQPYGRLRPSMSEVLKEIQEAISIERGTELAIEGNSDTLSKSSIHSPLHAGSPDMGMCKPFVSLDDPIALPTAR
ncbi:putative LRR receptor-like serine/threonine-protein kinase [Cinnamomum micranthum f. kanehirae]|uniref:Putative LRR receptor-like serine/threonine-protein kinase n=1 Tax=Cinnamomum micranthum f. kanehirae TaxID=337451 RepID=A0A3S3QKI5_9MAGN|nr:putative LRR receptor-like serine/threonine-protein kinase [Cinnamomum micranthum f. kanehirae]